MSVFISTPIRFSFLLLVMVLFVSGCSSSNDSVSASAESGGETTEANGGVANTEDGASNGTIGTADGSTGNTVNDNSGESIVNDAESTNALSGTQASGTSRVNFDITVPVYVSNALQVRLVWGDIDTTAEWNSDELWTASIDLPSNTENQLLVTFNDDNGAITLGSFEDAFKTGTEPSETFQLAAEQFDTASWDDDADDLSNIDELRNGTNPLVAQSANSNTSFSLADVADDLLQTQSGYNLDLFSSVVDELAFFVTQQTIITWPDDAHYQVQQAYRFTTLCEGGSECKLVPGNYLVINHATGERELLDIPYIDPVLRDNSQVLAGITLTIDDAVFETDSVNVQRLQFQCELGGSLITGRSDHSITYRDYQFNQCKISVRDSLIPDGIYVVQGSMSEDSRTLGGTDNRRHRYTYDQFSLVGDNGLEYRINGNTDKVRQLYSANIYNRSASISEYKKVAEGGQLEEWILDSEYRYESDASTGFWVSEMEMSGRLLSVASANQWVTVSTISPLMQHWHSASFTYDHAGSPFQGSYQMRAEDGSSLLATANTCFVDEEGNDCQQNRTRYLDVDYLTASGDLIQTSGVELKSPEIIQPSCETGTLRRTYILPGEPYINARDEGRLECTKRDQWHTDLYGRYTFGPVILPERSIIIP